MKPQIIHPADRFPSLYTELVDKYGSPKDLSLSFLPSLDNRIWGFHKGKLVTVAGRTSMGKSVFLLQTAYTFAQQGKKVALFSLEMAADTCLMRMMNFRCKINNWANIAGISPEDQKLQEGDVRRFHEELDDMPFVLIESIGKTFAEINKTIEEFDTDFDAIFIDYIQLVKGSTGRTDKQVIDEYIKQLREYAIKKNFCAVIGSQINRETYGKEGKVRHPQLWELKGSGALEEHSDMVILVHWQHHYTQEEGTQNDYWLRVAKNRDGRTGIFECKFEPEYYRLSEVPNVEETLDRSPYKND